MSKPKPPEPLHRFSLRLPRSMMRRVARDARRLGVSCNVYIVAMLGFGMSPSPLNQRSQVSRELLPWERS